MVLYQPSYTPVDDVCRTSPHPKKQTQQQQETRDFFRAFFSLSDFHWQGFLSSRLTFLQLIAFGLSLFANCNNAARVNLVVKGIPGLVTMLARLSSTLQMQDGPPKVTLRGPREEVGTAAVGVSTAKNLVES